MSAPSTENLLSIGKLLGVPVDALVNGDSQSPPEEDAQAAEGKPEETKPEEAKPEGDKPEDAKPETAAPKEAETPPQVIPPKPWPWSCARVWPSRRSRPRSPPLRPKLRKHPSMPYTMCVSSTISDAIPLLMFSFPLRRRAETITLKVLTASRSPQLIPGAFICGSTATAIGSATLYAS